MMGKSSLATVYTSFYFQVASAKLGGANKPDDSKLSELDRVGIGMGVTFFILIIIIVVILVGVNIFLSNFLP